MVTPQKNAVEPFDDPDRLCALAVLRRHGFHQEANDLQRYFGGVRLYIPKRPSKTDRHVLIIGMKAAEVLADELGGIKVGVRKGENTRVAVLSAHIALLSLAGLPGWIIAILLGVTERHVHRNRERWRDQGVMFPKFSQRNPFQNTARKAR
jgi:hypothetical protein